MKDWWIGGIIGAILLETFNFIIKYRMAAAIKSIPSPVGMEVNLPFPPSILSIFTFLIIGFIIGAIIGLIVYYTANFFK